GVLTARKIFCQLFFVMGGSGRSHRPTGRSRPTLRLDPEQAPPPPTGHGRGAESFAKSRGLTGPRQPPQKSQRVMRTSERGHRSGEGGSLLLPLRILRCSDSVGRQHENSFHRIPCCKVRMRSAWVVRSCASWNV